MPKTILSGNDAIFLGAQKAGLGFFSSYPITPASEILHNIAKSGLDYIQAEDEIAAINLCIGASLGGKKTMTASSGPGLSLKQESLGYAHMLPTPLVAVNVQRLGPSTGGPTMPAQGDILQTHYGSHGDYSPIVFYPSSVADLYRYTLHAFNAAEESLSPVILLSDGYLAHLYESVDLNKIKVPAKKRTRKPVGTLGGRHFTGLVSDEKGFLRTKDPAFYREWQQKYHARIKKTAQNYKFHRYYGNKKSRTLIIAYGICARVVSQWQKDYAIFEPIRLYPVLENEFKKAAANHKNIVIVEMNNGQYQKEIVNVLKRDVKLISQPGGRLYPSEIRKSLPKK